MPDPARHPSARELSAFAAGGLPDDEYARIARHLADCPSCRRAVASKSSNRLGGDDDSVPQPAPSINPEPQPTQAESADLEGVPPELRASDRYEVVGKLGEGGMGVVWLARHKFLHCPVVIKTAKADLADAGAQDRFLREMRATGQLQHPKIVRALDAQRAGELLILVMEYVEGVTLDKLVKARGPLPVPYACRLIAEAAEGLQHAHEKGLVHRDVKPSNLILTTKTKEVKVLDLGLARLPVEAGDGARTKSHAFLGTPEYVAPEQANDARNADVRADVYSLGCTLYYLLTGQPPFRKDTWMMTVLAHATEPPPPLSRYRKDVPEGLQAVVSRMLAKAPQDRYQTPQEVREALLAVIEEEPRVTPVRESRRGREKAKGAPVWAAVVAIMTVLAAVALLALWGGKKDKGEERQFKTPDESLAKGPADKANPKGKNDGGNGGKGDEKRPAVRPEPLPKEFTNSFGMKFVVIPAGTFKIGSPKGEDFRSDDEEQHEKEISEFHMGAHEVTQKQFRDVLGYNLSYFSTKAGGKSGFSYDVKPGGGAGQVIGMDTEKFPVENVSHEEAVEFMRLLNEKDKKRPRGYVYRLPREAEWEYACRGPGTFPYQVFHFGNSLSATQANFDGDAPYGGAAKVKPLNRTTTVGSYKPNRFGLFDMHGNVWEWCDDRYAADAYAKGRRKDPAGPSEGSARVLRGGCWDYFGGFCRSAFRSRSSPGVRSRDSGFRVALVPSGG